MRKEWIGFIIGLFFISVLIRWLPHPPNLTSIGAISILSGRYFSSLWGKLGFPLLTMVVSDSLLGFSLITPFVYLSVVMISLFSHWRKSVSVGTVLGSSMIFFLLSNLGVFILGGYGYSWEGLLLCYTMAIPFFWNTLIGDLLWTGILYFLGSRLYTRGWIPKRVVG